MMWRQKALFASIITLAVIVGSYILLGNVDQSQRLSSLVFSHQSSATVLSKQRSPEVISSTPSQSSLNLLCLVMTVSQSMEKQAAILDTWGPMCSDLLFLTGNATDSRLVQLQPCVYDLQLAVHDHIDNTWMKTHSAFIFVFENWLKPFDWLLRIDDDAFIFMDNFQSFVKSLDKERPLMFGAYNANSFGGYIGTGPGILLNHMAIERLKMCFNNKSCCDNDMRSLTQNDDVKLGTCLQMANVSFGKSSDSLNRIRFVPNRPEDMIVVPPSHSAKTFIKMSAYPVTSGFNCCSDDLIALHCVNPEEMRHYHKLAISHPGHPRNMFLLFNTSLQNFSRNSEKAADHLTRLPNRTQCKKLYGQILLFRTHFGAKHYKPAEDSLHCYALAMNYTLASLNLDTDPLVKDSQCSLYKDKMFLRHCVLAQYLRGSNYSYALAVDGDVAVVNPNHCIEDYIDPYASIIFYERFHTHEIAACSFLVKNDDYGFSFLMDWAAYQDKSPRVALGNGDNGALLLLLLEKRSIVTHERQMCRRLWEAAVDMPAYLNYVQCAYIFLGARRTGVAEKVRILRRGHGWCRDFWVSDGRWCEADFMLHGLKENDYAAAAKKADSPFNGNPIDLAQCQPREGENRFELPLKKDLIVACDDVRKRFANRYIVNRQHTVPYLNDKDLECWPKCDPVQP